MGMFDWVICDAPIPKPKPVDENGVYQTKDMKKNLDIYIIDKQGVLWVQKQSFDGDGENTTHFDKQPSDFTGKMNFYGNVKSTGRWREYAATFNSGQMVSVELIE